MTMLRNILKFSFKLFAFIYRKSIISCYGWQFNILIIVCCLTATAKSVGFNVLPRQICTLSLLANYCSSVAHIFCFLCIVMYVIFQVLLTRHKTLHSMYRWRLYHNPLRSDQPVVFQVGVEQDFIWVKYFRKAHGHDRFVQSDNQLIIEKRHGQYERNCWTTAVFEGEAQLLHVSAPMDQYYNTIIYIRKCTYGSVSDHLMITLEGNVCVHYLSNNT